MIKKGRGTRLHVLVHDSIFIFSNFHINLIPFLLTTYDLRLTTYDFITTYDLRLTTYDLRLTTYDLRLTTYDLLIYSNIKQ